MKNKIPIPIRIGLITAMALIAGFFLLFLLDTGVTNTFFADWFYNSFILKEYGTGMRERLNWIALKTFLIIAFAAMVAAAAVLRQPEPDLAGKR